MEYEHAGTKDCTYWRKNEGEHCARWHPQWLTLPQLADIHPLDLWHKEQEPFALLKESLDFQNVHVLARSAFFLKKSASLHLKISADDRYKLYTDGRFIQEGPAASHPQHYYYNDLQLPPLAAGEHVLGVHLYYQGCINRVFYSGDLRLALAAELTDEDGTQIPLTFFCCRTDAYSGALTGYDTQFLENFDAGRFPSGWCQTGFSAAFWEQMLPAKWADYQLYPQPVKMLQHSVWLPEKIRQQPDGSLFIDFGKELTGSLHILAEGKAGDRIRIRCAEEIWDSCGDAGNGKRRGCGDAGNEECRGCGGAGNEECRGCGGAGNEECRGCGGAGNEECRGCGGAGNEECRGCGGAGNEECRGCGDAGNEECQGCTNVCVENCRGSEDVRFELRCGCRYEEIWTLADGENSWEPYDYKGFRFAQLVPDTGVTIKEVKADVRHYPMDDSLCRMETDHKELGRIFEICRHAVRLGTQEAYIDCPTREKGQYLGDAVITAHAQVLLTGETDMLLKCISQFADTARVCPGLLAVAPGGLMQEIADFSLLFPELVLLYYQFTGETWILEAYYGTVQGMIEYFRKYARADGLLEQAGEKWNLVDWPQNLRDGYDFELSRPVVAAGCYNVINALYLGAVKSHRQMASVLGKPVPYADEFPRWKQAYQQVFFRNEAGLFADSEISQHTALHSNVYACYFGLEEKGQREHILDFIEEKGFSCGVMHSYFVLRTLAWGGRYDAVFRLLVNSGEHGWVQMLREGATACFEAWGKDQKWNTSLCHPWGSAPVIIILEEIAGFHPDPASGKGYVFEPHLPKEIQKFRMVLPFRGKRLQVEKKGDEMVLTEG